MNVKELVAAANAVVPKISPDEARRLVAEKNALVVDVRDAPEVQASGKVKGAVNVSRGMLDFRADPDSPYHDKAFSKDRPGDPLLRLGRPLGALWQAAQGFRLRRGV
jgi:predicted sulfurtransferase